MKIHQFEAGHRMFEDIPLCRPDLKRKLDGQWNPKGVTCRRCIKIRKTTSRPVA